MNIVARPSFSVCSTPAWLRPTVESRRRSSAVAGLLVALTARAGPTSMAQGCEKETAMPHAALTVGNVEIVDLTEAEVDFWPLSRLFPDVSSAEWEPWRARFPQCFAGDRIRM